MRRDRLGAMVGLLAIVSGPLRAAENGPIFRDMTFAAALKAAAAEKKLVMVDFYTASCAPCKRMDLTTWLDPAVASFLAGKAVSLRLNADDERKLADRYRLGAFPTMLIVRPDGTEVDRLIGFLPSAQFLSEFKDALAGKTAVRRARADAAAAAAKGDAAGVANARKELAGVLAQKDDPAGALKEYLWLFDDGMKKLPDLAGVRRSYVLAELRQLGRSYPPALAALRRRREAAKNAVAGPGFSDDDVRDLAALDWSFGEGGETLKYFDSLPPGDPRRPLFARQLVDQFLSSRRYADAAGARPAEKVLSDFDAGAREAWSPRSGEDKEMLRMNREFQMENAAEGIEALAGAEKLDDARAIMKRTLAVEDSPWVRAILLKHLKRAGRPELLEAF